MFLFVKIIVTLYMLYYTLTYARVVWRDGHKFAGVFIAVVLGGALIALPIVLELSTIST